MLSLATSLLLPFIAVLISAPTLITLFCGAWWAARDRRERMANLISGFMFSVGAAVGVVYFVQPQPQSLIDKYFGWFMIGAVPIGAAMGIAFMVLCRNLFLIPRSK